MYGSYDKAQSENASIEKAYLALLEKRHKKEHSKPSDEDVEKVAKELEKVADELKEGFALLLLEQSEGHIRVSPEKVAELKKKAEEFRNSITPEEMDRFLQAMAQKGKTAPDVHGDIHRDNGMCEAMIEDAIQALGLTEAAKKQALADAMTESFNNGRKDLDDDYVARQFAAGKSAERKAAKTDGKIYWLHGNEIARQHAEPGKMEFNWAGWYTPTTERHLNTILKQVAPGKSVNKKQHKDQGVERFSLDHFKAPDQGAPVDPMA
jgi:hypothetical protein